MATGSKSFSFEIGHWTTNAAGYVGFGIDVYITGTLAVDTSNKSVKVTLTSTPPEGTPDYPSAVVNVSYAGSSQSFTCGGRYNSKTETLNFTLKSQTADVYFSASYPGTELKISYGSSFSDSIHISLPSVNSLPTASISVPALYAGKDARITWSTSDADGDTVYTRSLVRYIKMPGDTVFREQKTLISAETTATAYTDTIPADAGGAQVYYYLGFTDKVGSTQYKQSSTRTVSSNTAPTEPGTLLVSGDVSGSVVSGGGKLNISWTSSIDTDGNLAGYELERQENGGSWKNIFTGSARETETVVTEGIETLRFRVRAYDTMGAKSGYTTGTRYTVNNNKAPIITISTSITGGSIGTFPNEEKESPVLTYTVTDPENTVMTVEEFMDGVLLRRETATGADARMISFTPDAWIRVINGEHVLRIVATDADGSVGSAEVRFTKDVDRIEIQLKPDINRESDTRPSIIMVNVQGLMPAGSVLKVEAANNANDAEPAWEDMTSAVVSRGKHIFANEAKMAEKWAVNVRITLERGEAESVCAITSVGGNWK